MRIAIIHNNAKTGATVHALALAARLQERHSVTFLAGILTDDGVDFSSLHHVLTFPYTPEQCRLQSAPWPLHVSLLVRLRLLLYHLRLLRPLDKIPFLWQPFRRLEQAWLRRTLALPPALVDHFVHHDGDYDVYIVLGNFSGPAFYLATRYARKTVLIPLVHFEMPQFILSVHDITSAYSRLAYNTSAERALAERIHGPAPHSSVIGVGIDTPPPPSPETWEQLLRQHHLDAPYLLYMGRLTRRKTGKLFSYFIRYKRQHPSPLCLVLIGDNYLSSLPSRPDILSLGFVPAAHKAELLRHALLLVNPSTVESLSLILLEAMHLAVPVLVNGRCQVLKDHCTSGGGGMYYTSYRTFAHALDTLLHNPRLRADMGLRGQTYECCHYSWPVILREWEQILSDVLSAKP